jgi:hypothetical protein
VKRFILFAALFASLFVRSQTISLEMVPKITVSSEPGNYQIQWSTNVDSWQFLTNVTVLNDPVIVIDYAENRSIRLYRVTQKTNDSRIIFIGDSLSTKPPYLAKSIDEFVSLPDFWIRTNIAVWGKTLAAIVDDAPANVWPFYDAHARANIAVIWAGTNDLKTDSAETILYRLRVFCLALKSKGWQVVVCPPMSNMINEEARIELDIRINAEWPAWADGYADFVSDPRFGARNAYLDNPLFADWIHPNNYGMEILGPILNTAINKIVK